MESNGEQMSLERWKLEEKSKRLRINLSQAIVV